jgi:heme-degrading monooxygenase HmoA
MSIKHIVMWKVRGDDAAARAANLAQLKSEFESLRGRIPGLLHIEVGIDESRIDYACDVVLVTEFASREALAGYAEHPEHLRVRRALGDMRSARHQVDYEVTAEVAGTDRDRSPLPAGAAAGHPPTGDTHHVQTL